MKPGKELLFLALGGSGEIGMNANLYGCDGKWVMVDLGMTFSDPAYPGVELVFPDLEFIEERADDLLGIVLTHGHEDHIGALPYLAADLNVPLFATPFTADLIRRKLEEQGLVKDVELNVIENEGSLQLGPFGFRYLPLAHSIAEGNALLIDTPYGRIFHTGDWKLDDEPIVGVPSTPETLTALGDEGVLAMVCDSTNVFNPESSGSEGAVRDALIKAVKPLKGRALITTFASNVARLHTLGEVAKATNRAFCVAGRSLDRIIAVAKANGYLKDLPELVDFDTAMGMPRRQVLVVATGGQGEPRAALARVAEGNHQIKLEAGDTVLFSSKVIPGNEIAIGRIQNKLAEDGIQMITDRQADIHVSGHPGRPELAEMYRWIRPQILVPVHGEMRHMTEQARFGTEQGIPSVVVQKNGDMVRLAPGKPGVISRERAGRLVLDGDVILPADGMTMAERRKLAVNGQVSVAVALDGRGGLIGDPVVRALGLPVEDDLDAFIAETIEDVREAINKPGKAKPKGRGGRSEGRSSGGGNDVQEAIRLAVRRAATRWTGKKPVVTVLMIAG
ncbi:MULTISPECIES: ribonuclease J [Blastomonas]|uniref:MBL fold hydrolase n=1 Tax=Blastomonas fulva TaxID=1550728 RepID=A0ABN5B9D8_9SPHN|nr:MULTISPECIES: ribonuclease J [Blastomonas]ASR52360.1 MBL fold hydrolase [Blastomonas fulva]KPF77204.1 MBL fold metallo-hydrolase [Blastomonas sp. AAP25]MDM7929476.1 ribonuclease J [Blastomonas fulva]MDM7965438.1 ribonuclease J [Blastomonas fulva]